MLKNQKERIVEELKEKILRSKAMYFADFTGITVEQVNELRREFYKVCVDYHVVKNTLIKKALESLTGFDKIYERLVGPTSIAFSYDDPIAPARIIKKFNEKSIKLKVKSCVIEKQIMEGAKIDQIAMLPTRTELIAQMIGSINIPITGIVGVLNACLSNLVYILDGIEKKKSG